MAIHVGFEIDWNIIRASVIDSNLIKIIKYEDRINLAPISDGFLDPTETIQKVWESLDLDPEEDVKVAVSIGLEQAGLVASEDHEKTVRELKSKFNLEISWFETDDNLLAFVRSDYITVLKHAFVQNGIPLHKVELAPQALLRILKNDYSGDLTLTSGAGWRISVKKGVIKDAETTVDVLSERGAKIVTKNSMKDVSQIRNLEVPDSILTKYQIRVSDLFVSAGAALGLDKIEDGLLGTVPEFFADEEEVVDFFDGDSIDIYNDEEEFGLDLESKKTSGIFGKFRKS